ncbi:hypothetical protein AVEN_263657-1 [Araneus ventricosus]|uniref:Uncharacterized protein n=1 Tax=Araneus ventricosus TaxID=182803 RepID=A0A4Y2AUD7_ARAVE|nr:hypothetical protein AVEN_263657-1 [Araneus ventricosus]
MFPLCMIVGSSGRGKVLPQEDRVPGGHVAVLRGKTAVFGAWLWRIVLRLRQKFELQLAHNKLLQFGYFKDSSEPDALYRAFHGLQTTAVCDVSGVKLEFIGGRSGDLLCFLTKAGFALVQ